MHHHQRQLAELNAILDRIGLAHYLQVLQDNGFDDWPTLMEIREVDLDSIGFKLGHKRKLQRAIAAHKGQSPQQPLTMSRSSSIGQADFTQAKRAADDVEESSTKRRYRRHPKPDANAPKRPKTAYMNFSDELRKDPDVAALSFVDIARIVGRRWQELHPDERTMEWEKPAENAMLEYEAAMDKYKLTEEHRAYLAYLDDFKAKHEKPPTSNPSSEKPPSRGVMVQQTSFESDTTGSSEYHSEHKGWTHAIDEAIGELTILLYGPTDDLRVYSSVLLPPEDITRSAVRAFINGTGTLFFTYTHREPEHLLNMTFGSDRNNFETFAFIDVLAMAAVGAYYDTHNVSPQLRRSLYYSCMRALKGVTNVDYLRCMRLFLCLAIYCTLNKSASAKRLITAAVQIGRDLVFRNDASTQDATDDYWRKVFRSVMFVECWLCYSLGHRSVVTTQDIDLIYGLGSPESSAISDVLQNHCGRVGVLAADIGRDVSSTQWPNGKLITYHSEKLKTWYEQLPSHMHLSNMDKDSSQLYNTVQRRLLLLIHLLQMGASILLYRHLVIAIAQYKLTCDWELDLPPEQVWGYTDNCFRDAVQTARIAATLKSDGRIPKHSWILIYQCGTACGVLLFSISQKLLHRTLHGLQDDIHNVEICIDVLTWCGEAEPLASRYVKVVEPIYLNLLHLLRTPETTPVSTPMATPLSSNAPPILPPPNLVLPRAAESLPSIHAYQREQHRNLPRPVPLPLPPAVPEFYTTHTRPEGPIKRTSSVRLEALPLAREIIRLLLSPFGSVDPIEAAPLTPAFDSLSLTTMGERREAAPSAWWD